MCRRVLAVSRGESTGTGGMLRLAKYTPKEKNCYWPDLVQGLNSYKFMLNEINRYTQGLRSLGGPPSKKDSWRHQHFYPPWLSISAENTEPGPSNTYNPISTPTGAPQFPTRSIHGREPLAQRVPRVTRTSTVLCLGCTPPLLRIVPPPLTRTQR